MTCPSIVEVERELATASPAIASTRPHQFEVVREANAVILRGEVPSATEQQRIVDLAGGYFGNVRDEMRVSNELAGSNYTPAADRALAVVSRLDSGQANWSGEQLSVSGTASADGVATARAEFETADASGFLGHFDVQSPERNENARQDCNAALNDVLSKETIRFQTGSATIDTGNEVLLERLATLAGGCPGNLTIEGHTDSRGDAGMNEALSLARAAAVRDALTALGIDNERLSAVGYGEARPIANNESAAGRASNRRIAISVDESE
jgi:OOP family OmpA-OmpF porin